MHSRSVSKILRLPAFLLAALCALLCWATPASAQSAPPPPGTGLRVWLKADAGVTIDGGRVTRWEDQSGEGHHALEVGWATAPTFLTDSINGRPAVRLGNMDRLETTGDFEELVASELFIVFRKDPLDPLIWGGVLGDLPDPIVFHSPDGRLEQWGGRNNGDDLGAPIRDFTRAYIYGLSLNADRKVVAVNGVPVFTGATTTLAYFASFGIGGGHLDGAGRGLLGEVAEILFYDRELAASESADVLAYLQDRYATVPEPEVPQAVTAGVGLTERVELTWSVPAGQHLQFEIQRAEGVGAFTTVASGLTRTVFQDETTLVAGQTYHYRVRAADGLGRTSPFSASGSISYVATPPPLPSAGLNVWLRADRGLTLDAGGRILRWRDQSGRGHDAGADPAPQYDAPLVLANQLNGQSAAYFEHDNSRLRIGSFLDGATAGEFVIVIRRDSPGRLGEFHFTHVSEFTFEDTIVENFLSAFGPNQVTPTVDLQNFQVLGASARDGEWRLQFNGVPAFEDLDNVVGAYNWSTDTIVPVTADAARYLGGGFVGSVAEIIFYDRVLESSDRVALLQYLDARYDLVPAPAAAPVLAGQPTLTNTAVSLSWNDPGAAFVEIERKADGEADFTVIAADLAARDFVDRSVVAGVAYTYRARLRNGAGETSAYSNEIAVAGIGAAVPVPITDLQMWLRADAGVTVSPTTGQVTSWRDQGALGHDALTTTDTNRDPQGVEATVVAGQAGVVFRDFQSLEIPGFRAGATAGEIFFVLKKDAFGADDRLSLLHNEHTSSYPASSGQIEDGFLSTIVRQFFPSLDLQQPHLFSIAATSGEWTANFNGLPAFHTTDNVVPTFDDSWVRYLGGNLDASIADVLFYNRVLTPGERLQVLQYVQARYGIIPTPPPPLSPSTHQSLATGEVSVDWIASPGGALYDVERQADGEADFTTVASDLRAPNFRDATAQPGTPYTYRIRARNVLGEVSDPSDETEITVVTVTAPVASSGLRLWLRSDTGAVTTVAGGITSVAAWRDQSGTHNDATQRGVDPVPQLVGSMLNGQPAVSFVGYQDFLQLPDLLRTTNAAEVVYVLKKNNAALNPSLPQWYPEHTSSYPYFDTRVHDSLLSQETRIIDAATNLENFHVVDIAAADGTWSARWNGIVRFATNNNIVPVRSASNATAGLGGSLDGAFVEVLIYDRVLSEAERTQLVDYLQNRYALLPAPVAPSELAYHVPLATGGVALDWNPGSTITGYFEVERSDDGSLFTTIATGLTESIYRDTTAVPGQSYTYRVRTRNAAGEASVPSDPLAATAGAPTVTFATGGLQLWLRSDTGLRTVTSGSVAHVTAWRDQSPAGHDARAENTAQISSQPQLLANRLNGQPAVVFEYDDDRLEVPAMFEGATAGEYFLVLRRTPPAYYPMVARWHSGHELGYPSQFGGNPTQVADSFLSTSTHAFTPSLDVQTFHVYGAASQTGAWTGRLNGLATYTTSANVVPTTITGATGQIGGELSGDLIEVIVFDRVLDVAEREAVHGYLHSRYALFAPPATPIAPSSEQTLVDGAVVVDWYGGSSLTGEYEIERMADGEAGFTSLVNGLGAPGYRDTTVEIGRTYTYRVRARNAAGLFSDWVTTAPLLVQSPAVPVPVSGMQMWLRADRGVTRHSESGTDLVDAWRDQSGQRHDAIAEPFGVETRKPALQATALSGGPAVSFDADEDFLLLPDIYAGASAGEFFYVLRKDPAGLDGTLGVFHRLHLSSYSFFDSFVDQRMIGEHFLIDGDGLFPAPITLLQPHVFNVSSQGGALTARLNGVVALDSPNNTPLIPEAASPGDLRLGRDQYGGLGGYVAEVIFYDRVLTPAEREQVGQYLQNRYTLVPDLVAPSAVSADTALASSAITVAWQAGNLDQVLTYEVQRATGVDFAAVATGVKALSFRDASAVPGTSYVYRVRSHDGFGRASAWSAEVAVVAVAPVATVPVNGVALWLRSDRGVSTDANGFITQWRDQSGRNLHATAVLQSTNDHAALVPAAINGHAGVRLAGMEQLDFGAALATAGATEIFVFHRKDATGGAKALFNTTRYPNAAGQIRDWLGRYDGGAQFATSEDLAAWHLYNTSIGADWVARINGAEQYRDSVNLTEYFGDLSSLGDDGSSVPFAGEVTEVLIFDRLLSAAERSQVASYFFVRYQQAPLAAPVLSPDPDRYSGSVAVSLSTTTPDATISYTLDGSDPVPGASPLYTAPIGIARSTRVRALSELNGQTSAISSGFYSIGIAPATDGPSSGFAGTYYASADFTGSTLRRLDRVIDFPVQPFQALPDGYHSVRWTGSLTAQFSETYTFHLASEGRPQLWIGDTLVIDGSGQTAFGELTGSIALDAGQAYPVRLDYTMFRQTGVNFEQVHLEWSSVSIAQEIVPARQVASGLTYASTVATPAASPPAGAFTDVATITLAVASPANARIHYTVDGSDPTTASPIYIGPISLWTSTVLKARGYATGHNESGLLVATYTLDNAGPVLANVTFNNAPIAGPFGVSGIFRVSATDATGVARVEFDLDGVLLASDTVGGDGYSAPFNINAVTDGAHTLTIRAHDTLGVASDPLVVALDVTLPPPAAPSITSPTHGRKVNRADLIVRGSAERDSTVSILRAGSTIGSASAGADGSFAITLALDAGANDLTAVARNRNPQPSAPSAVVRVIYDNTVPAPPIALTARGLSAGRVVLSWQAPGSGLASGYHLFRSTQPIPADTVFAPGSALGGGIIRTLNFTDTPAVSGQYYYRVVTAYEVDADVTLGEPSNQADVVTDATPPAAVVSLAPLGPLFDPALRRFGRGLVEVTVTPSEPLAATPFVNLAISGGGALFVPLAPGGENRFTGIVSIESSTPAGNVTPTFSGLDLAGNRGTQVTLASVAAIDTRGPRVTGLTPVQVVGGVPEDVPAYNSVKNEPVSPATLVTLHWRVTLDEAPKPGTTPVIGATLSSAPGVPVTVSDAGDADPFTWLASLDLPPDAGVETEMLTLSLAVVDDLDNTGDVITPPHAFQIYIGVLPPLAVPTGFTGTARPAGEVQLAWTQVSGAAAYVIQVQGPGDAAYADLVIATSLDSTYTYTPAIDGLHRYRIASVRTENGEDSISGWSPVVSVTADRVAPNPPTNLALLIVAQGVGATWTAPAANPADVAGYELYRAASSITTISGLTPAVANIPASATVAVDAQPVGTSPYYAVIARDTAGNRSGPVSGFINVGLLPVRSLQVARTDDTAPLILWQPAPGSVIDGFNVLIDGTPVEIAGETLLPPSATTYVDDTFAGGSRRYTIRTVSGPGNLDRSILFPEVSLGLAAGSDIKRGLFNTLPVVVRNLSPEPIVAAQVTVSAAGRGHTAPEIFDLAVGEERTVSVVVGGYSELTAATTQVTLGLLSTPHAGERITIGRSQVIPVALGAFTAAIVPGEFTRGGTGKVRFQLTNPSNLPVEFVAARQSGALASHEVRLNVIDPATDSLLSTTALKMVLGDDVVLLPNGTTVIRIPANTTYTSPVIELPLPLAAPTSVEVALEIDQVYFDYSQPGTQVTLPGPRARVTVSARDTSYVAEVTSTEPATSDGSAPIVIRGRAYGRGLNPDLPGSRVVNASIKVSIEVDGFIRRSDVITDSAGEFLHVFTPGATEPGGVYRVWASHPDSTAAPENPATFTIRSVTVTPLVFDARLPRNYRHALPVDVDTGPATSVTNLRAVLANTAQADVAVDSGVIAAVGPNQRVRLPVSFVGLANVPDASPTGVLLFDIVSDAAAGGTHTWATVRVDYQFSDARPLLQATPHHTEIGVQPGQVASETLTLQNNGFAPLEGATATLVSATTDPLPAWIRLQSGAALGAIDLGATVPITVAAAAPTPGPATDVVHFATLRITGTNVPTVFEFPVTVTVSPQGTGNAVFQIVDPYYQFTVAGGAPNPYFNGVVGATVTLEKESTTGVPTLSRGAIVDANGEASFADLPAGRYKLRVTADKHEPYLARVTIKPGLTHVEQIQLRFNPVTFTWEVVPVTFEDRYEITLGATYETNVPVPVVVVEPGSLTLPEMCAGQVLTGEFRITNHGLIDAEAVRIPIPASDANYRYEILSGCGDKIRAGQSIRVAYRVTCLQPFPGECAAVEGAAAALAVAAGETTVSGSGSRATAGRIASAMGSGGAGALDGGGDPCGTYVSGVEVFYTYECSNGQKYAVKHAVPIVHSYGNCSNNGGPWTPRGTGPAYGGGGPGGGPAYGTSSPSTTSDDGCFPEPDQEPDCKPPPPPGVDEEKCERPSSSPAPICMDGYHESGSWVDLLKRQYRDNASDLIVPVPGGNVTWWREFNYRRWRFRLDDDLFAWRYRSGAAILVLNGTQFHRPATGPEFFTYVPEQIASASIAPAGEYLGLAFSAQKITRRADGTFRWEDGVAAAKEFDNEGRLMRVWHQGRLVTQFHRNGAGTLTHVADRDGRTVLTLTYTNNRVTRVEDFTGRAVSYGYDSEGRLTSVIDPLGTTHSYAFDAAWHLTEKRRHFAGSPVESDLVTTIEYQAYPSFGNVGYSLEPPLRFVPEHSTLGERIRARVTRVRDNAGADYTYGFKYDPSTRTYYSIVTSTAGTNEEKRFDARGSLTQQTVDGVLVAQTEQNDRMRVRQSADGQRTSDEYDDRGNLIRRTYADGALERFEYDLAVRRISRYTDPLGVVTEYAYDALGNQTLKREAVGTPLERETVSAYLPGTDLIFRRTDPSGLTMEYEYDSADNLLRVFDVDHPSHQTRYTYDALRRRVSETDALSRVTTFAYDAAGRLTQTTNPLQETTINTYVGDQLVQVESGRTVTAAGRIVRFEYDTKGRRTKLIRVAADGSAHVFRTWTHDGEGRVVSETNALGQSVFSTYDSAGNRIGIEEPDADGGISESLMAYDDLDRLIESIDAADVVRRYDYDSRDRQDRVTEAPGTVVERTTRSRYDLAGRLAEVTQTDVREPSRIHTTTFTYDALGRRTAVGGNRVDPATFVYDASDRLVSQTDAINRTTTNEYDPYGRVTAVRLNGELITTAVYDLVGNRLEVRDGLGSHRHFHSDELNRLTHESVPLASTDAIPANWWTNDAFVLRRTTYNVWGEVESTTAPTVTGGQTSLATAAFTYDAFGRRTSETDAAGYTRYFTFDAADNLVQVTYPPVEGSGAIQASTEQYLRSPHNAAVVDAVIDRAGNTTHFTYDAALRVVAEENGLGGITTRTYDALGRVASVTDPANHTTSSEYNLFDQPVVVTHPDHVPGTRERIETVRYDDRSRLLEKAGAGDYPITHGYDAVGRLTSMTDGNNRTTQWSYTVRDQVDTKTYADATTWHYTYDAAGRLATRRDALARTTSFSFNAYGLPTGVDYPTDADVSFTYDQQGRRLGMTDASGATTWTYDAAGRPTSQTQGRAQRRLGNAYNAHSLRTSLTVTALNASGQPEVGTPWVTTFGYQNSGRLQSVLDARHSSGQPYVYSYATGASLVAQITGPNGLKTLKTYDSLGRLLNTRTLNSQLSTLDSFTYTYDAAGQRETETTPETARSFGYDQHRQLTSAVTGPTAAPSLTLTYDFDAIGNRIEVSESRITDPESLITSYTTNSVNQYTAITGALADIPTHDLNGNTTALAGKALRYDEENRLVEVSHDTQRVLYVFDGLGRRVERQEFSRATVLDPWTFDRATRFVYDGWRVVEELEAVSPSPSAVTLTRSYTLGTDLSGTMEGAGGIGGLLALTRHDAGSTSASYVYDGNGNVTDLVADDGSTVARYRYDPFGNRLEASGTWANANPIQFSSKPLEPLSGFYYYGLRYYSPATGKWLGRDPIGELGGMNLYGFVGNDPISRIDLLGMIDPCRCEELRKLYEKFLDAGSGKFFDTQDDARRAMIINATLGNKPDWEYLAVVVDMRKFSELRGQTYSGPQYFVSPAFSNQMIGADQFVGGSNTVSEDKFPWFTESLGPWGVIQGPNSQGFGTTGGYPKIALTDWVHTHTFGQRVPKWERFSSHGGDRSKIDKYFGATAFLVTPSFRIREGGVFEPQDVFKQLIPQKDLQDLRECFSHERL